MLYSTFSSSSSPPSLSRSRPLAPGTGRRVTTASCTFSPASSDATAAIPKIQIPISHSVGPLGHGSIFLKLTLLRAPHPQPSSRFPTEDFNGLREFRMGRVGLFGDSLASFTQTYVHKPGSPPRRAAAVRAFFSPDPSVRRSRSAIAIAPESAFLRAPRHEIVSLAHRPERSHCLTPSTYPFSIRRISQFVSDVIPTDGDMLTIIRREPISANRRKGTWGGADEGGYERRRMQRNGDFCKGNAKPHFALAFSSGWMSSRGWRNGGSERVSEYRKLCHFFSLKKSRASSLCSFLSTLFAETRMK